PLYLCAVKLGFDACLVNYASASPEQNDVAGAAGWLGMKGWQPTERGTPQGAVISPMLANIPTPILVWFRLRRAGDRRGPLIGEHSGSHRWLIRLRSTAGWPRNRGQEQENPSILLHLFFLFEVCC